MLFWSGTIRTRSQNRKFEFGGKIYTTRDTTRSVDLIVFERRKLWNHKDVGGTDLTFISVTSSFVHPSLCRNYRVGCAGSHASVLRHIIPQASTPGPAADNLITCASSADSDTEGSRAHRTWYRSLTKKCVNILLTRKSSCVNARDIPPRYVGSTRYAVPVRTWPGREGTPSQVWIWGRGASPSQVWTRGVPPSFLMVGTPILPDGGTPTWEGRGKNADNGSIDLLMT